MRFRESVLVCTKEIYRRERNQISKLITKVLGNKWWSIWCILRVFQEWNRFGFFCLDLKAGPKCLKNPSLLPYHVCSICFNSSCYDCFVFCSNEDHWPTNTSTKKIRDIAETIYTVYIFISSFTRTSQPWNWPIVFPFCNRCVNICVRTSHTIVFRFQKRLSFERKSVTFVVLPRVLAVYNQFRTYRHRRSSLSRQRLGNELYFFVLKATSLRYVN